MTERDMQDELVRRFEEACDERESLVDMDDEDHGVFVERVRTFDDGGLLTRNAGVVLKLSNGDEFQLTIVQSREGGEDR